ncbi:MAG: DegV family protein [Mycoplasmatales bacterium]|nr:DegV family protein [Mycoplasmatales bacterium]
MKLGIIVDSSSGMSKKESEKRGYGFLPLFLNIDGQEYRDGVDINNEEFFKKVNIDSDIRTSASPPGLSEKIIHEFSEKYDYVIVYPLSEKLSSQCSNLKMVAQNFDNVHVVTSKAVGRTIIKDIEEMEKYLEKSSISWEEVKKKFQKLTDSHYGVAAPKTMKWLVKGGRVSPAVAGMANLLKIVPIISLKDGSLEKFGKGRVFKKAIIKMTKLLKEEVGDNVEYVLYNGGNPDIEEHKKDIEKVIGKKLEIIPFPPVILSHIGPGVIALITRKSITNK